MQAAPAHPHIKACKPGTAILCAFGLVLYQIPGHAQENNHGPEAFMKSYCVSCHGKNGRTKGNLNLLESTEAGTIARSPALLAKILKATRDLEMPPEDAPQPPSNSREAFATQIEIQLDEAVARFSEPPKTQVRRMNRFQYSNAVGDLFELKVDLFQLPERILRDHSGYFNPASGKMPESVQVGNRMLGKSQLIAPRLAGVLPFPQDLKAANGFDTRADLLSLSPLLMESFLDLSRSVLQSPDFTPRNVGSWDKFFANPRPGEDAPAVLKQRLSTLLEKAFRHPSDNDQLERYFQFASKSLRDGDLSQAMKSAAGAVLASPEFLYLHEGGTTGLRPEPVNDTELASRLSFFLWSSIPDDALRNAASEGRLKTPEGIREQVDRMLDSPKMKRLCDAFASQWMKIEHLQASDPDPRLFRDFRKFGAQSAANRGSVHTMLEPLLLFETVLIENRSVLDFIHSDFTYRSDQLQAFVNRETDIPKSGAGPNYTEKIFFKRRHVESKREGGIITTAAVLTMTSSPTQTKPITRGKWVIETLFNDPPPPPPADVPGIEQAAKKEAGRDLSLRERFALHRERAECASCHVKLDAYGFALENYDAVGRWRDSDETGNPIDSSGSLFHKYQFGNIGEFKDALLAEKHRFVRAFSGHLLKYALGRELAPSDKPALDAIVIEAAKADFKLRAVIKAVALSEPFRFKFNPAEHSAAHRTAHPTTP